MLIVHSSRLIGSLSYHVGRFAHYSGFANSAIEAALRYAPLAIIPSALISIGSTVQKFSTDRRGSAEKGFAITSSSFAIAWALSASLAPSQSTLLPSSLSSHLYSYGILSQIGKIAASNEDVKKKISTLLLLLDLPIVPSLFCPRLMSGLYLVGSLHTLGSKQQNQSRI